MLLLASSQAAAAPAEPPAPAPLAVLQANVTQSGTKVSFDQALGLAAEAPAVVGAEAAVAEQRRVGDSVSSMVANPTLTVQPGTAKDPLDDQWKYLGEATLMQTWNLSGLPGNRKASLRAEGGAASSPRGPRDRALPPACCGSGLDGAVGRTAVAGRRPAGSRSWPRSSRCAWPRPLRPRAFTRAEAADAATYAAEAHVLAIAAEGEVVDRGFQLAVAMGQDAERPVIASGPLPSPPAPARADWPALVEAAGKLPAVVARKLAGDAERARELEVRSGRGWGLGTGVKGTRDYLGTWGVQAVLEVSMPIFDQGAREAAPQASAAVRSDGEHREALAAAATELSRSLHEMEHTGEVLVAVEKELFPAATASAQAREASMRAGETTVLEVLVARRALAAARAKRTRALASHAWAQVKVWMLLADLTPGGAK